MLKITECTKILLSDKINQSLIPQGKCLEAYKHKVGSKIAYLPNPDKQLIPIGQDDAQANLFLQALEESFSNHFPIKITPDALWTLVIQGVAQHIKLSEAESRSLLVKHKGKKKIKIRNDKLIVDASEWANVPAALINEFKKDLVDASILGVLIPKYSTTTPIETTSFCISVMDVFSSFFEYSVVSMCGIPEIYLEGTLEDWQQFKNNLEKLEDYGLGWWVKSLYPVLDKIANAVSGEVDTAFWQSIYKVSEESGGPFLNGWIVKFFPYLRDIVTTYRPNGWFNEAEIVLTEKTEYESLLNVTGKNPFLYTPNIPRTLKLDNFQTGVSKAEFDWNRLGINKKMCLVSGVLGVSQDVNTYCLVPEIGWCVTE